jgi:hypothetical protein
VRAIAAAEPLNVRGGGFVESVFTRLTHRFLVRAAGLVIERGRCQILAGTRRESSSRAVGRAGLQTCFPARGRLDGLRYNGQLN